MDARDVAREDQGIGVELAQQGRAGGLPRHECGEAIAVVESHHGGGGGERPERHGRDLVSNIGNSNGGLMGAKDSSRSTGRARRDTLLRAMRSRGAFPPGPWYSHGIRASVPSCARACIGAIMGWNSIGRVSMAMTPDAYRSLSFWHATLPGSLEPRPPLGRDEQVDVAIVGAGYTGL